MTAPAETFEGPQDDGPVSGEELAHPAISVRHLWHRYGNFNVLRDVSFDVYPGEIYGFIGPNGAGKTTTIRILATLVEPMAGRVEIDGWDVAVDPNEARKVIGYMPDHAGVYERITVREYLEFFADAHGVLDIDVVDAVIELTDLHNLQQKLVVALSKGMKQRLQLARILLHDPKVLILDEPASDLDPRARIEMRDLLLELKELGKTILLSSHILTELSDVCTSVGILEKGQLLVTGPIDEIADRLAATRGDASSPLPVPPMPEPPPAGAVPGPLPPPPGPVGPALPTPPGAVPPEHAAYAPPGMVGGAGAAPMSRPPDTLRLDDQPRGDGQPPAPPAARLPVPAGATVTTGGGVTVPATARRRVKLRLLGDPRNFISYVQGGTGVLAVRPAPGGILIVDYQGSERFVAALVRHLVGHGADVVGVEPERNELERIFLEVTKGDLQ